MRSSYLIPVWLQPLDHPFSSSFTGTSTNLISVFVLLLPFHQSALTIFLPQGHTASTSRHSSRLVSMLFHHLCGFYFDIVPPVHLPLSPLANSPRFVLQRTWLQRQRGCLSCSSKLQLTSRRPRSCRVNWAQRCRTVRAAANASLPWKHSWKVLVCSI